ncbi:uncharacterized protein LOC108116746 [Drosophila eugracilis]|uniref:uncharacterized protein LOC108116746 n=1 Tax=Drosophila eugracilis TaxID=29029 RepID=UPI0007E88281|nr:uncharacterized protein LOC108116746 [Drosophila eugracilis]
MHTHFSFFGFLILVRFLEVLTVHSTGNCSFAFNTSLTMVCKGNVPQDMYLMFRDNRAPTSTPFSLWRSEEEKGTDPILLVSFYTTMLADYDTIFLHGSALFNGHFFLVRSANKPDEVLFFTPSTLHCFPFSMRYLSELRRYCLGYSVGKGDDFAQRPILHYGSLFIKRPEIQKESASTCSPTTELMILCAIIVYKSLINFVTENVFQLSN